MSYRLMFDPHNKGLWQCAYAYRVAFIGSGYCLQYLSDLLFLHPRINTDKQRSNCRIVE